VTGLFGCMLTCVLAFFALEKVICCMDMNVILAVAFGSLNLLGIVGESILTFL